MVTGMLVPVERRVTVVQEKEMFWKADGYLIIYTVLYVQGEREIPYV